MKEKGKLCRPKMLKFSRLDLVEVNFFKFDVLKILLTLSPKLFIQSSNLIAENYCFCKRSFSKVYFVFIPIFFISFPFQKLKKKLNDLKKKKKLFGFFFYKKQNHKNLKIKFFTRLLIVVLLIIK